MRKFKIGLIGLGGVAEAHLAGYRLLDSVEVVAAAELREDRRDRMAAEWGLRGYSSFEEMLAREPLDVVCVLTPARTHREVIERAAPYGVNILCEKPLATTMQDAQSILEECNRAGIRLCYGASYRFLPACRKAKQMIDEGLLGRVTLMLETSIGGQGVKNYHDLGSAHYPAGTPGGGGMGLVDHGVHLIDLFSWFTGSRVMEVFGRGACSERPPCIEFLTMLFEDDAVGQLIYNEATFPSDLPNEGIFSLGSAWDINGLQPGGGWAPHPGNIRVHGEEGALRIFHYANKLHHSCSAGIREIPLPDWPMPGNFARQMQSFVARIREGREPEVSGLDGVRALQVVLATYESFELRRAVRIEPRL
jgi:predicted dehydrogenase